MTERFKQIRVVCYAPPETRMKAIYMEDNGESDEKVMEIAQDTLPGWSVKHIQRQEIDEDGEIV